MRSSRHRSSGDTGTAITTCESIGSSSDGRVAVVLSWADQSGRRHEWAHVLELHEGMIVDMEDYASGAKAARALHRWPLNR